MANVDYTWGGFERDDAIQTAVMEVTDPNGDVTKNVFRFPVAGRIRSAYAESDAGLAAGAGTYFTLNILNAGVSGTATTVASGTIGGTAGWTAHVPATFTISEAQSQYAAGEYVAVKYDETADGAGFTVFIHYSLQPT